jgi:DNA-binding CsgD family transcriptional regulator
MLAAGRDAVSSPDNGSYFQRRWAAGCAERGIAVRKTRPYRPQTNGKAERFIRTLLERWAYAYSYRNELERASALPEALESYDRSDHTALSASRRPFSASTTYLGRTPSACSRPSQAARAATELLFDGSVDGQLGSLYIRRMLDRSTLSRPLSPREEQVLQLMTEGMTNQQIAGHLCVTVHAVKFHLASIYRKFEVHNRTEAVVAFLQANGELKPRP